MSFLCLAVRRQCGSLDRKICVSPNADKSTRFALASFRYHERWNCDPLRYADVVCVSVVEEVLPELSWEFSLNILWLKVLPWIMREFSKSNHNLKTTPHLPNPRVHANIKPFDFESIFHVSSLRQPLCTSAVVRAFGSRGKVFSLLLIRKWRLERRFFFFRWTFSRAQTHPTSLNSEKKKKFSEQSDCETICITISWELSAALEFLIASWTERVSPPTFPSEFNDSADFSSTLNKVSFGLPPLCPDSMPRHEEPNKEIYSHERA